ncbi:MAG: sulfate permease-like transporter, superfamily [Solirubrobacterales bacterium]|nr:sulfate permease-like transporter, superfamily [Solirubrobacterales bacterium]
MVPSIRFDRHEISGAVADVGVLVPIAAALIVSNGLSATAVLLPAALLYIVAGLVYRLPVPVQPLKAFGAIAIAKGLGADDIAAGALLMGVIFLVVGATGLVDLAARAFPRALVRGVQLSVGLLFLKIAWGLVHHPPKSFAAHALDPSAAIPLGLAFLLVALLFRRHLIALVLVTAGVAVAVSQTVGDLSFGPSALALPSFHWATIGTALTVLVLPQLPLSFANSCVATADAARNYFGDAASRVRAGRLATTLGAANLLSGAIAGMPVCHGAGGMTAHRSFGARTAGAPLFMGGALLVLALGLGAGLATLLAAFPLTILGAMLAAAGVMHLGLLRDLQGSREWSLALVVGLLGLFVNLAIGLAAGLILWWLPALLRRPQPA